MQHVGVMVGRENSGKAVGGQPVGLDGVSWDDINLIASVAVFDSLRQAAKALGMNASTLVRHMERLEMALGTMIFDRHPQGFVLNEAGLVVADIARDMQRQFYRLHDVASKDQNPSGQVRIAITEGLGTFWVAPRIPGFSAEHPGMLINLESSMELRNPLRNEADIAIQFKKPENPDLVVARLCHMHIYPFASLGYIENHGMPVSGHSVRDHRIVIQETSQFSNDVIDAFLRARKMQSSIAFVTNSSIAHLYAVERGMGIGGLPTFSMAMGAALVPIDINLQHTTEIWISYRRDMRRLKRVAVVIEWLRQIFSPQRYPWFSPRFMHPADVMRIVNKTMNRESYFDSSSVLNFLESKNANTVNEFKRSVGRPRLNT
jgi:DNA-binding transcriptional LysR family regulator